MPLEDPKVRDRLDELQEAHAGGGLVDRTYAAVRGRVFGSLALHRRVAILLARRVRRVSRDARIAIACATTALIATLLASYAAQGGRFSTSAMVNIASPEPLASLARAGDSRFRLANPANHYDGAYYYAIAQDPLGRGNAHNLIDQGAYRYGHPLYGWLARLLSVGVPSEIPNALFLSTLFGMMLAGWALSRLAVRLGGSPWLGLAVASSPGLLSAATVDTPEPICIGIAIAGLLAWSLGRWTLATAAFVLLCLGKEQFVAVPVGLAILEVVQTVRGGRIAGPPAAKGVALAAGPVVLSLWYVYVHHQFRRWPFDYESGNFGRPFAGWIKTFHLADNFTKGGSFEQVQLGALSPPILAAFTVLFACAAVKAARLRSILDAPLLLTIAVVACQGWRTILFPHELLRTPAAAVLLSVVVLFTHPPAPASRRRGVTAEGADVVGNAA